MARLSSDRIVSPETLCAKFNDGDYWNRMKAGEFRSRPFWEGTPGPGHAWGAVSRLDDYHDKSGAFVARVHYILNPDRSLGGSKRPEPKILIEDGVRWIAQK